MEIIINNLTVLIDEEVYKMLQFIDAKLYVYENNKYPLVVFGYADNKSINQDLHRFVMGCPKDVTVDHINRNPLDCRIKNLRYATKAQQIYNRGKNRTLAGFSSKYKGVCWRPKRKKWAGHIYFKGKQYNLGNFNTEEEAALAYNNKARELMGEFAYLNEISSNLDVSVDT